MNWLENIELEEVETMFTEENEEQLKERFKIKDLSSLNWALRKLKVVEKAYNADKALWDEEIARLTKWFNKQSEGHNNATMFLEGLISEYAKAQRVIDPKWKQKTPHGHVGFRKAKKFNYGDEEKLVQYLADNGMSEYVKVVKSPIRSELKKVLTIVEGKAIFTSTGEVLPEIVVEETEDVTIKLEV